MDVQNNNHLQEEDNDAAIVGKKHQKFELEKKSKFFLMTFWWLQYLRLFQIYVETNNLHF